MLFIIINHCLSGIIITKYKEYKCRQPDRNTHAHAHADTNTPEHTHRQISQ